MIAGECLFELFAGERKDEDGEDHARAGAILFADLILAFTKK